MYPSARLPVLMCDGSAVVRHFGEANRGADPNTPSAPAPQQTFQPSLSDPPGTVPNGGLVYVGTRWTRMGLQGRDLWRPRYLPLMR
jgi:hypothetical protein